MASAILTIFIVLLSAAVLFLLIVLVSPFTLRTDFSVEPQASSGTLFFSWMHPVIVRMKFDISPRSLELRIFGRRFHLSSTLGRDRAPKETTEPPSSTPGSGPEKMAAEQAAPASPRETVAPDSYSDKVRPSESEPVKREEPQRSGLESGASTKTEDPASPARKRPGEVFEKMRNIWKKITASYSVLRRYRALSKAYRWSMRILSLLFSLVRFDHFRLYARAGMDDPAVLGRVYGWYTALNNCLVSGRKNCSISFEPRFFSDDCAFSGSIGLRTSFGRMFLPAAIGLLTFPYLSAFLVWRRLKKIYRPKQGNDTIG